MSKCAVEINISVIWNLLKKFSLICKKRLQGKTLLKDLKQTFNIPD